MVAAGIYIRTLRESQKLSRAEVAHRAGTHESQIVRIESGEQDTRGSLLVALVHAVGGSFEELARLMLEDGASIEEGKELARRHLNRLPPNEAQRQYEVLKSLVAQLEDDPRKYGQLLGYAQRLLEEPS